MAAPALKPALRGALHHWAALFAAGAGVVLVAMAQSSRAAWAAAGYALSVVALFGTSAAYHRPTWGPRGRAWMRRADHAAIFVLIGGTYTAICLLALPGQVGLSLLGRVWLGAAAGALQALLWINAPKPVSAALYLALGWIAVPHLGLIQAALAPTGFGLLLAGGVAYSLGALAYALRWPNPRPAVFGYHEVFHALTLLACALHFAVVLRLVRSAG